MGESKRWESVYRSSLFKGKVALVTGGGTGIAGSHRSDSK
jgi:hypothetical protein